MVVLKYYIGRFVHNSFKDIDIEIVTVNNILKIYIEVITFNNFIFLYIELSIILV